jgi:hypothetical protein
VPHSRERLRRFGGDRGETGENLGEELKKQHPLGFGQTVESRALQHANPRQHVIGEQLAIGGDFDERASAVIRVREAANESAPLSGASAPSTTANTVAAGCDISNEATT